MARVYKKRKDGVTQRYKKKGFEKIGIYVVRSANLQAGHHWFDPDTIRFFRSRFGSVAYKVGNKAYFISSEQFVLPAGSWGAGHTDPRKYSIREIDFNTGAIRDATGTKFQEFYSNSEAMKYLKQKFLR